MDTLLTQYTELASQYDHQGTYHYKVTELKDFDISEKSARAKTANGYLITFKKSGNDWLIKKYPPVQIRLTAVSFLLAMENRTFEIARHFSTEATQYMLDLMEQYEKLSRESQISDSARFSLKDFSINIWEDSAKFSYKNRNNTGELFLLKEDQKWKVSFEQGYMENAAGFPPSE